MELIRGRKLAWILTALSGATTLALLGRQRHTRLRSGLRVHREGALRAEADHPRHAQSPSEAALSESQQLLKVIFEQAPVGIERVRLSDGRLLEANPTLGQMLDYPPAELLTKTFAEITDPRDLVAEHKLLRRLIAGEIPKYAVVKRYLKRDGSPLWVRVTSCLAQWTGREPFRISIISDITELKQAEANLRQTDQVCRLIVENARDFALITLDLEGRVTSWNIGAERVYGWKAEEIVGKSAAEIFTPEDRAQGVLQREMSSAMQNGHGSDERWHLHKDNTRFYFAGSVWPLIDEHGNVQGFAKVGVDITSRKRLEEELARAKADLEGAVARRTAELSETVNQLERFSYSLSHDMRAPLRAIRSYTTILKTQAGHALSSEQKQLLDRAAQSAQRMDNLIRDVLTYHRTAGEEVQLHRVDTEQVLDQTLTEWTDFDASRVEVTVQRPLLPVLAHEGLLTQCLSNLLVNAIRFVPSERKPQVKVWTERRDGQVRLWVEDNGIGIARQDQEVIWEMFRTLHHEHYGGTGIGLAIVRMAAQRMGGSTGVESEPGRGSRFWVQLPAPQD